MRKFTFFFKSLLVAAGLLLGSANAWGGYTKLLSQDFENVETYTSGWTVPAGVVASQSTQSAITGSSNFLLLTKAQTNSSTWYTSSIDYTSEDYVGLFQNIPLYKYTFWYGCSPARTYGGKTGSNSECITTWLTGIVDGVSSTLFTARTIGEATKTNVYKGDGSQESLVELTTNSRWTVPTIFFKFEIEQTYSAGTYSVKLTISNSSGTAVLSNSSLYSGTSPCYLTALSSKSMSRYQSTYIGFDDITLQADISYLSSKASTAITKYNSIKDAVMNSTVKSTLDGAKSALDAFGDDAAIIANIPGYVSAISALETANENAETSADNFAILNNLIEYSKPAGYVDPSGAETVYTSNADVDPVALASSVRAAVVTAGTVSNNTDISAVIANKSFELGSSIGWTIAPSSDDSGINVTDGVLTIFPNGNTVSQNVGTLPAGRYKLSAKAWSSGATVYLIANENHSGGTVINGDNLDVEYTFTLTAEEEVTIGINSGDQYNGNAFVADGGKWWYRCDNFTLTYVDDDPLGRAQKALNDEIDAATDVKNAWTPRVGTIPFKYNSTYYDALVTELSEANAVKVGGSDDPDDYTTAKTELEGAKDAMASSVLNEPASDKYYRLYLAEDGVSTGKNLNMLKYGAGNTVITEAPYPVKFVKSGENYIIENAYDYYFVTPESSNSSWGTYTGLVEGETMEVNANVWSIVPQEDGTFKMLSEQESWKSWSWYVGTFSTDEGSKVAPYDNSRPKADRNATKTNWLCSEPVDVTETPLFVSAAAKTGTFISAYDNLTPATVKAYTVAYKSGDALHLEENESGVLSANTPYILTTEEVSNVNSTFKGIKVGSDATSEVNGLVGLLTAGTVPSGSYVLQNQSGVTSFYKTSADLAGTANRCYLDLTSVPEESTPVKGLSIIIVDGTATGVEAPVAAETVEDGIYYNLNGQQVTKDYKGIVIVNGKKFYNK